MPSEIQVTIYLQAPTIAVSFPRTVVFSGGSSSSYDTYRIFSRLGAGAVQVGLEIVGNEAGNSEFEFTETPGIFGVTPIPCIVFERVGDGVLVKLEIIENEAGNNEPLYTETAGVSGITPVASLILRRRGDLVPVKVEIIENEAGNNEPLFNDL